MFIYWKNATSECLYSPFDGLIIANLFHPLNEPVAACCRAKPIISLMAEHISLCPDAANHWLTLTQLTQDVLSIEIIEFVIE